jgi:hypothetical protein
MLNTKQILLASMAILMASASSALAGTKAQANLVPATDPTVPNPTMSTKGKVALKDTGALQVSIKGVTDGTGAFVTSATAYDPADPNTLAADDYTVMVKMNVVGAAAALTVPAVDVEYVVPLSLKKGNGAAKLDLAGLVGMLTALGTVNRSFEVRGGEVWGPLGANLADCKEVMKTGGGGLPVPAVTTAYLAAADPNSGSVYELDADGFPVPYPACRGGVKLGVAGINAPPAAP